MTVSRSAVLFLLAAACGPSRSTNLARNTRSDSAGVQIVTSRTPAWDSGGAWIVDSTPETTIGGDASDQHQQFKYVLAALRLADGRIAVAEEGDLEWFDATGKYLRTLPAAGQGPGEFQFISELMHSDSNLTLNGGYLGGKTATYSADGTLLHDETLDIGRFQSLGRWVECRSATLRDGSRLACQDDPSIPATGTNRPHINGDPGPGLLRQIQRMYVVPPTLDTIRPLGLVSGIEQFGYAFHGRTAFFQHPFYSNTAIAHGGTPLRIAIALNPAYSIEVWTTDGKLDRIIRRPGARRVPTAAERADGIAMLRQSMREYGDSSDPVAMAARMELPDSLPTVIQLAFDGSDNLFVVRDGYLPSQLHAHVDVFDPSGTWLGTLTLPPRIRLLDIGTDFILLVRVDGDDVPHVEAYRLARRG